MKIAPPPPPEPKKRIPWVFIILGLIAAIVVWKSWPKAPVAVV
jgi:hypothetical protein